MNPTCDLQIEGAIVVAPDPKSGQLVEQTTDVSIQNGRIVDIGAGSHFTAAKKISAKGLHLLPGAIDTQVHFREPGFPEKEDLATGTLAAIFGGVTSIFEMPNTQPPTLTAIDMADKMTRAKGRAWCNYSFYMGASPVNAERLSELENLPGVCGVKMFMGSSTGNLIVGTDDVIEMVLKNGRRRVAVHAEDETRLKERKKIVLEQPGDPCLHPVWRDVETALIATKKVLKMARKYNRPVHILHVSSAEEAELLASQKDIATFEVTPQHLTLFAPDCYEKLGTFAQMNPPIREKRHLEALWTAIAKGHADVIGSDHAPHTIAEKKLTYPDTPSGLTGVQTLLPLMLHHSVEGRLSLKRVVELTAQNPAKIFFVKNKGEIRVGFDADFVLVDMKKPKLIQNSWIQSRCGWTSYDGMTLKTSIIATLIRGTVVMRDDQALGKPQGQPLF